VHTNFEDSGKKAEEKMLEPEIDQILFQSDSSSRLYTEKIFLNWNLHQASLSKRRRKTKLSLRKYMKK